MKDWRRKRRIAAAGIVVAVGVSVPSAALAESCEPVINPYPDTMYEGVDLTDIRAKGVSCSNARRVVEKAHKKGLGLAPDEDGYLYFRSNGWQVKGNLRPSSDRYHAARGSKLIRWRF